MPAYHFERIARTPQSEQWRIDSDDSMIGRVDLHFTTGRTYGSLAVHTSVPEGDIEELIAEIDARLVSTADEYREDFVVSVWRGEDLGVFAEDADDEDAEDEVAL